MLKAIDSFVNQITMYRLVLYGLVILATLSVILGFLNVLPYSGFELLTSLIVLSLVCFLATKILSRFYNVESSVITALILFFILEPSIEKTGLLTLAAIGLTAVLSRYILAWCGKHIFNPAALAAVIFGLTGSGLAVWWVGSEFLLLPSLILGFLVTKKIRRASLVSSFIITATVVMLVITYFSGYSLFEALRVILFSWPLIFFATIMLTEPLTTPPRKETQLAYGVIVGSLFSAQFHFGPIYPTPELALVIGNIFSFIVSNKGRFNLRLRQIVNLTPSIKEFIFTSNKPLVFLPGQYMEFTVQPKGADNRGNRRYFTLASSPTEQEARLGIRYNQPSSSFKERLKSLKPGDRVVATQAMGDFILPKGLSTPMIWLAGGIGITPFRSMAKFVCDNKQTLDCYLFYLAAQQEDFVYREVFEEAATYGLKTFYLESTKDKPFDFSHLSDYVKDYKERFFYISGPNGLVESFSSAIIKNGVSGKQVIKDYFPGF